MLADEYELDHAVAHCVVPFFLQLWVVFQEFVELFLGHCGEPLACLLHRFLLSCLLEYVAHVSLVGEIADALGTHYVTGPFAGHKLVEESQVERLAAVIYKGADAVFLHLASFVIVVMVVMMVVVLMLMMMFVLVMMLIVLVMMLIVFVVVIIVVVLMFLSLCLNLLNPACGGGYFLKVELMGVDDEVEVYVAVVAFEYLGLGFSPF